MNIDKLLEELKSQGNLRKLPHDLTEGTIDFSSNDYLGLASAEGLRRDFFETHDPEQLLMTSSASRLLASSQRYYAEFEDFIGQMYGRHALLLNSGWHANTGILPAIADHHTLIVADRLVHASIIDGIRLSGAPFERFRHNDYDHLEKILQANRDRYETIIVVAESVYSMDGDRADIGKLVELKHRFGVMLYIDEAHAVGVLGPSGLGLCRAFGGEVDIIVGTFGKALASMGAYAVVDYPMKKWLLNRARSFIFSTALPPAQIQWSMYVFKVMLGLDDLRQWLGQLGGMLGRALGRPDCSQYIQPLIVGTPEKAVAISLKLKEEGFNVMPIRRPTVPPGTDRLRFSLSAAIPPEEIERLGKVMNTITY